MRTNRNLYLVVVSKFFPFLETCFDSASNVTTIAFELVNQKSFMIKEYSIFQIRWENHIGFENKSQIDRKETTADVSSNLLNRTCRMNAQLR